MSAGALKEMINYFTWLGRLFRVRPPHQRLYAVGAFKLANYLVNLGITSYTEQWSVLAPAGVLM
jgi:hypothetical protein